MQKLLLATAAAISLSAPFSAGAQEAQVAEYSAQYAVFYKGREAARAEFAVVRQSDGRYVFSSLTKARGILRALPGGPASERSVFGVEGGSILPQRFEYDDGTRKGEDSFTVTFDAAAGQIRIDAPDGPLTVPLEADLLDRGSLQVALMLDLANCHVPETYRYVDDDGVTQYTYERLANQETGTGIGVFDTVRISQSREGSSRNTVLWMDPTVSYVPIRIEQYRDGELETVFSIDDLVGVERKPPACSGLR